MANGQQISKVQQERLDILVRAGLKMAGFKPAHLRKAHKATVSALDAKTIRRAHDRDGVMTRKYEDEDHNVRLLAARQIMQMIPGMFPSQGAGMERDAGSQLHVQIILLQADGTQHLVDVSTSQPMDKLND